MGRKLGETVVYFWHSKIKGERYSWFFPSRIAADRWRQTRFYKYYEYSTLEAYIKDVPESRKKYEVIVWKRHRDGYHDLTLKMGRIKYAN